VRAQLPAGRLVGVVLAVAAITFLTARVGMEVVGDDGVEDAEASAAPEVIAGASSEQPAEGVAPLAQSAEEEARANARAIARAKAREREAGKADESDVPVGLRVGVNDRVKVKVEVDGEPWFDGHLCPREGPRCDRAGPLKVPRAAEIAVALSDLTHARLIYNGRRVEPLGNLDAGRRLVFVDDAGQ